LASLQTPHAVGLINIFDFIFVVHWLIVIICKVIFVFKRVKTAASGNILNVIFPIEVSKLFTKSHSSFLQETDGQCNYVNTQVK